MSVAAAPPMVATAGPIDPATALRQEVLADDAAAESLIGSWVPQVSSKFPTSSAANAWCVQQQHGVDDCFAKRLSHTEGPAGNTAAR